MTRKKYTSKFKTKVVLETLKERFSVAELSQKHDIAPQQIHLWKREFLHGAESVFESKIKSKKSQADEEKDQLQSVPGVGKVIAVALLVTTKGFTCLTNPRKLACYAGIAPFPYRSGSSISYGDRVSKLGNARMKGQINLSAWNAIRSVPSLKAFYEKKVNSGKHKMSAINAVRNKLLAIILAVIKRDEPFTKDYFVAFS